MLLDEDTCYRALVARDARFDGTFFVGVLTTGIYCRPVCPARTPRRANVRFFRSAAAASAAGLRACRRCRPDTAPGSREWDHRADLVARALRLIASGAADESGVETIANELSVTARHLNRALVDEVGTTAGRLARTRRAQNARILVEHTDLPFSDVAFASGFRTVRQFNDVMREQLGVSPSQLRRGAADSAGGLEAARGLTVRLPFRPPYAVSQVLGWMGRHAVGGVDQVDVASRTVRTRMIDGGTVSARFEVKSVVVAFAGLASQDLRDIPRRIAAVRRWLDLDASPGEIDAHLHGIPELAPWVDRTAGLRVVGALDPFRSVISTIVSQQVSVKAAATQNARLVGHVGDGSRFPSPQELAQCDGNDIAQALGIPKARGATLVATARAVAAGEIELTPGPQRETAIAALAAIKGVGPWTVADVKMRALGDPDVWPAGDLILRRAVQPGGRFAGVAPEAAAPWRSYLAHHVWIANAGATTDQDRPARTAPSKGEPS